VRRIGPLLALVLVVGACAAPTGSGASAEPSALAKAPAPGDPAVELAGTWRTGDVPFEDIEAAIVAEGLPAEDFETWAEAQQMIPWPAEDGAETAILVELELHDDATFMVTVESAGERLGIAEQGTWSVHGTELNLATGPGLVNHVLLTTDLAADTLALTVLDIQEADHDAAYAHLLNAVAYYASGAFTRSD
jgi:hypothetical protein